MNTASLTIGIVGLVCWTWIALNTKKRYERRLAIIALVLLVICFLVALA
jgi:hypothetical protein